MLFSVCTGVICENHSCDCLPCVGRSLVHLWSFKVEATSFCIAGAVPADRGPVPGEWSAASGSSHCCHRQRQDLAPAIGCYKCVQRCASHLLCNIWSCACSDGLVHTYRKLTSKYNKYIRYGERTWRKCKNFEEWRDAIKVLLDVPSP